MSFLALIVVLSLTEIALFVTVGGWIGLWWTMAIILGTALAGILLIRAQGSRAREQLRLAMLSRDDPSPVLANGAFAVVSGILLILPGFLADALGLLLLVPPVRALVIDRLSRGASRKMAQMSEDGAFVVTYGGITRAAGRRDEVIDGTWEELPDDETRPPSGWTRH